MSNAYEELEARIRVAMPEDSARATLALVARVIGEVRRDQARADAVIMQKLSERCPNTTPPKGGTNGRIVFASAAEILHPDELGWSLNPPPHLTEQTG